LPEAVTESTIGPLVWSLSGFWLIEGCRITHNEPISTTELGELVLTPSEEVTVWLLQHGLQAKEQGRLPPGLKDTDKALMYTYFPDLLSQLTGNP